MIFKERVGTVRGRHVMWNGQVGIVMDRIVKQGRDGSTGPAMARTVMGVWREEG